MHLDWVVVSRESKHSFRLEGGVSVRRWVPGKNWYTHVDRTVNKLSWNYAQLTYAETIT